MAEGEWTERIISRKCIVSGKVTLLRVMERIYQMDVVTCADQVIPCWLVKGYISGGGEGGGVETAVRSGIKSWFNEVGLSMSDPLLGLFVSPLEKRIILTIKKRAAIAVQNSVNHIAITYYNSIILLWLVDREIKEWWILNPLSPHPDGVCPTIRELQSAFNHCICFTSVTYWCCSTTVWSGF